MNNPPITLNVRQRRQVTRAREQAGLSMRGLADALDVSAMMISRLESGERGVSFAEARRICKRLGLTLSVKQVVELS